MKNIIDNLNQSPLFNLSLSSKELFHSNFIAWVADTYKEEFGKAFLEGINLTLENATIQKVYREQKNLDLTFEYQGQTVIIENKVKSVPNKDQLIKYRNKNGTNKTYILLTLITPTFNPKSIDWQLLTYKDLYSILTKFVANTKSNNQYHLSMIKDYTTFIDNLWLLTKTFAVEKSDPYDYLGKEYHTLKEIRLHDLYTKHKYNRLAKLIQESIANDTDIPLEATIVPKYDHSKYKGQLTISTNFVRGKGVINIDYSNEKDVTYGIMLDGNKYDLYTVAWGSKDSKTVANYLKDTKQWFTFDFIKEEDSYPKKNDFNKFNKLLYRCAKIKNTTTIEELLKIITKDVKRLITLKFEH